MRTHSRHRKSRRNHLGYAGLEERRLLAAIIRGSGLADQVDVKYVDPHTVDVSINETRLENVDISDGLLIQLNGGQDRVLLDHRITQNVVVLDVEELTIDGGENQWFVGFLPAHKNPSSFQYDDVAGRVNENIRFRGATTLRSGNGADEFTINTGQSFSVTDTFVASSFLNVYAGDGDDLFRFNQTGNTFDSFSGANSVSAFGEGGNDRFWVKRLNGTSHIIGGDGFDVIDYSDSEAGSRVSVGDFVNGTWGAGNEIIIGSNKFGNQFESRSTGAQSPTLDWIIRGDRTVVMDKGTGAFIELRNFDSFGGDPYGVDNFWILKTARNLTINDGDYVHISSEFNSLKGNLSTINHDVLFRRSGPLTKLQAWNSNSSFPVDLDGVVNTRIVISDAMGSGVDASFLGEFNTISGLTGGLIRFVDDAANHPDAEPFQPEIVVHGAFNADDDFVFLETASPINIFSHGGDDTFVFGSTNKSTDGNMDRIDGQVSIHAGDGDDRIYLNDQAFSEFDTRYELSPNLIRDGNIDRSSDPPSLFRAARFADIRFDSDMEIAQVNGSSTKQNSFRVVPSYATQFVVDAFAQTIHEDSLSIRGLTNHGQLVEANDENGVWIFSDGKAPVRYLGIEAIYDLEIQPIGFRSTRVDLASPNVNGARNQ